MSGIAPIHLIGLTVAVILFSKSAMLIRNRKESVLEFLMWSGFGLMIFLLSLGDIITVLGIFQFVSRLLQSLGFQSSTNGIFTLAILGILILIFYTYINSINNRKEVHDLNREIALLRYEQEKSNEEDEIYSKDE